MSGEGLRAALERIVAIVNEDRVYSDIIEEVHAVARIALAAPSTSESSALTAAAQAVIDGWEAIRGDLANPPEEALRWFGFSLAALRAALAAPSTPEPSGLAAAGWKFLDSITRQDYVGQNVDVDPAAIDEFKRALRAAPSTPEPIGRLRLAERRADDAEHNMLLLVEEVERLRAAPSTEPALDVERRLGELERTVRALTTAAPIIEGVLADHLIRIEALEPDEDAEPR